MLKKKKVKWDLESRVALESFHSYRILRGLTARKVVGWQPPAAKRMYFPTVFMPQGHALQWVAPSQWLSRAEGLGAGPFLPKAVLPLQAIFASQCCAIRASFPLFFHRLGCVPHGPAPTYSCSYPRYPSRVFPLSKFPACLTPSRCLLLRNLNWHKRQINAHSYTYSQSHRWQRQDSVSLLLIFSNCTYMQNCIYLMKGLPKLGFPWQSGSDSLSR